MLSFANFTCPSRLIAATYQSSRRAFSLVELSIVLVILGLLVGGVLSGQSLVHAAELRTIVRDEQKYIAATHSFRDKYFALPGDMTNATSFWSVAAACPGTNTTTSGGTCDGDGDGKIATSSTATNPGNEMFRYWQHLSLAGLVEGVYSGTNNGTTTLYVVTPGVNVPKSSVRGAGWTMYNFGNHLVSDIAYFDGSYGNAFLLTRDIAPINQISLSNCEGTRAVKPEDAWNIDTKVDDGKPSTGTLVTLEIDGPTLGCSCDDTSYSSTASLPNAQYLLTNSKISCNLIFKTGM